MAVELSLLFDLGFVIVAATIISLVMHLLRQPLVLGYVIGGFIVGPSLLGIIKHPNEIQVLSELGVAFLLFIIGLEIDLKRMKQVGPVALVVGLLQVIITFFLGYGVALLLGLGHLPAFFIGAGVTFSSTMVVVKILQQTRELESLHGQIVLGIMLVQDIMAVLVLSLIPSLNALSPAVFGTFALKMLGFFAVVIVLSWFVLPWLMRFVSNNSELLFLTALSVIFGFGYVAGVLDFSVAIGAFLAGVALSSSPLHLDIAHKVGPLRDFFLVLFFVVFGMQISFDNFGALIIPIIAVIVVSTLGKGTITFLLLKMFRYGNRTSFLAAVQKAQISEFSLVIVTFGVLYNHVDETIASILTIGALITIVMTPYVMRYDDKLFVLFTRLFPFFRSGGEREQELSHVEKGLSRHVVIFGFHKMTPSIIHTLTEGKQKFVVVDHNPEKVRKLRARSLNAVCGSMDNPEIYEKVSLHEARLVISTIQFEQRTLLLIRHVRKENPKALIIVAASSLEEAERLYKEGADYVIVPESVGGQKISNYLQHLTPQGVRAWGRKHRKSIKDEIEENEQWK